MSMRVGGGSRPPRSNSVKPATPENQESDDSRSYDEQVIEQAQECVEEFRRKYPKRGNLPLTKTPGESLSSRVVEEEYIEEYVEGDREWEQGHTVRRLERAEPLTWADALFRFLVERQPYDDGLGGKFRDLEGDETFTVDFHDCWTAEYGDKQAARNTGAERQLIGGQYPDKSESRRAGEIEEGEWSDTTAAIVLTRTGSSVPDGERLPPVDFLREIETWTADGTDCVYQTVRNICEYHLGLEPEEWGFIRGDDVHGMSQDDAHTDELQYSTNACYPHFHDVIYIDVEASSVSVEQGHAAAEVELEDQFYRAIEKHLEMCDIAAPEAHTKEKAVEARIDLEKPAGYATSYLRLDDETEMMEQDVEMQAFAALEWATNRKRIGRSNNFNDAAAADLCKQQSGPIHGNEVRYSSGHGCEREIVCADCGSGIGIEAESLTEHRTESSQSQAVAADGGQMSADTDDDQEGSEIVRVQVGESTSAAAVRHQVRQYRERHRESEVTPQLLGELGIDPVYQDVAEAAMRGEQPESEVEWGDPPPDPEYRLEAIVRPDGSEEPASPGGGGVRTTEVVWPEQRLMQETRLQYVKEGLRPKIVVEDGGDRFATYNPGTAAGWLVSHGYRKPWYAELAMEFTRHGEPLPTVFDEPAAQPPSGVQHA